MDLIEGLTLRQVLAVRGRISGTGGALIGIDLCRAVAAVHKAGLLHRDIKVHNVMREAGGRIVLMDFGAGEVRSDPSRAMQASVRRSIRLQKSSLVPRPRSQAMSTASASCSITS